MKTASEIQLEALAEAYDDMIFTVEGFGMQLRNLIDMVESHHTEEEILKYANGFLYNIDGVIEGGGA